MTDPAEELFTQALRACEFIKVLSPKGSFAEALSKALIRYESAKNLRKIEGEFLECALRRFEPGSPADAEFQFRRGMVLEERKLPEGKPDDDTPLAEL